MKRVLKWLFGRRKAGSGIRSGWLSLALVVAATPGLAKDVSCVQEAKTYLSPQFFSMHGSGERIRVLKERTITLTQDQPGWCSHFKAGYLIDLVVWARPKIVVEIGVFGGRSLLPMAFALAYLQGGKIYGIDPWTNDEAAKGMEGVNKEWWSNVKLVDIQAQLYAFIGRHRLQDYVVLMPCTSEDAGPIDNIDILHIDGNHSSESSLADVRKWVPLVSPGGFIVFDDITWGTTEAAVKYLDKHCYKVQQFEEGCVWGVWQKI